MSILQSGNILLRAPEPQDIDTLYQWENNTAIWEVSHTLIPFSRHSITEYVLNTLNQDIFESRQLRLIICKKKEPNCLLGTVDIFDYDPLHARAGIGILIADKKNRNKGIGHTALGIILDYCFRILQLHQVYCNINKKNKVSMSLFRTNGFLVCGEKKEWLKSPDGWEDEYTLQLLAKQYFRKNKIK